VWPVRVACGGACGCGVPVAGNVPLRCVCARAPTEQRRSASAGLVAPLLFFAAGTGVAVPCVTPGRPPSGRSMATGSTVTGGAASLASPVPVFLPCSPFDPLCASALVQSHRSYMCTLSRSYRYRPAVAGSRWLVRSTLVHVYRVAPIHRYYST
jgi:hypothetical protein